MSQYINTSVTINKPEALTHGKQGVIIDFNKKIQKYQVQFESPWVGWYKKSELIFEEKKL